MPPINSPLQYSIKAANQLIAISCPFSKSRPSYPGPVQKIPNLNPPLIKHILVSKPKITLFAMSFHSLSNPAATPLPLTKPATLAPPEVERPVSADICSTQSTPVMTTLENSAADALLAIDESSIPKEAVSESLHHTLQSLPNRPSTISPPISETAYSFGQASNHSGQTVSSENMMVDMDDVEQVAFANEERGTDNGANSQAAATSAAVVQYRRSSKQKAKQEWPCTIQGCSVILYSKSSRFRHQKLHENPSSQYNCPKCEAKFLMKLDLIDHERRAHMSKDSYVVCDKCERTFSSMSNLNAHKEIHERSSVPKHVCHICNVAYFHRSALHRHQRNDHGHVRSQSESRSETASLSNNSPVMMNGSPRSSGAAFNSAPAPYSNASSTTRQSRILHHLPPPSQFRSSSNGHVSNQYSATQSGSMLAPFKRSFSMTDAPSLPILRPLNAPLFPQHQHQLENQYRRASISSSHVHTPDLHPSATSTTFIKCSYCNDCSCKSESDYHQHLGSVHNLSPNRQCIINQCNQIIRSQQDFEKHKLKHPHFY